MAKKILVYGVSNHFGGIETFFINVIRHADKNLSFDFIMSNETACSYEDVIRNHGGTRHAVTPWGKNAKEHNEQVKAIVLRENYDYVWVNTASASNISIYKTIRQTPANIIIHSHGSAFETRNTGLKRFILQSLHRLNKRKLQGFADLKFASSNQAAKWLFNQTIEENPTIQIIQNGIEADKYRFNNVIRQMIREKYQLEDKVVIGHIGRLAAVKNHDFLVEVFYHYHQKQPNSVLMLVGDGQLEQAIREKVAHYQLDDHVLFLGYLTDVENYLQACDFFVLPSFNEGLSIATIEAQASGLKCWISDTVPHEVGITDLVTFESIDKSATEWANQLLATDANYLRQDYSAAIKDAHFDISSTIEKISQVLDK